MRMKGNTVKTKLMAMLLAAGAMLGAWADTEAVDGKSCALSVKVTPNGKAVATLTYDTGKESKGKAVLHNCAAIYGIMPPNSAMAGAIV